MKPPRELPQFRSSMPKPLRRLKPCPPLAVISHSGDAKTAETNVTAMLDELTTAEAIPITSAPANLAITSQKTKPVIDADRFLRKIHAPPAMFSEQHHSSEPPPKVLL